MMKTGRKPAAPIEKNKIIDFLNNQRKAVGIRNIMIGVGTKDREGVKKAVKKLQESGKIERTRGKKFIVPGRLPSVTVLEVVGTDEHGDVIATPLNWDYNDPPPQIYVKSFKGSKSRQADLGRGDRCLARLQTDSNNNYSASIIKKLAVTPKTIMGVYEENNDANLIKPADRKHRYDFIVVSDQTNEAKSGDLVLAEVVTGKKHGRNSANITEIIKLEQPSNNKVMQPFTKIAIYDHEIPFTFSHLALQQANSAKPAPIDKRDDLQDVALVTIDEEDARDFDDAVFAEPDIDKKNPGGWHIIVAIADVAWYVRSGSELDKNAFKRGNSVYFPDQVVPMLPESLSNGWCSLNPNEQRPCLAVHMWIDINGRPLRHKFVRGLIKSHARLTYNQVQAAIDGTLDDLTTPLFKNVIGPLYGAYDALNRERSIREPLDLDLPEKRIILDNNGTVQEVRNRPRLDSHKLIEEFMIAANVCAAKTLEKEKQPCLYRIHDEPPEKNLESYRNFLKGFGYKLPKGQVLMPRGFNQILRQTRTSDFYDAICQMTLRSQSQAIYTGQNAGHFGLALRRYCHFTSPIRRYADLVTHRALISTLKLGAGGLGKETINTDEIGIHLSGTERRAAAAERDTIDRFSTCYLSDKIGETFKGKISGVTKFGLFVTVNEIATDGLVPIRSLPYDYYDFDEKRMVLKGTRKDRTFCLGMEVEVKIKEVRPISGSLVLEISGSPELRARKRKISIYKNVHNKND